MSDYDRLDALERRGDELEAFADCARQANEWMAKHGGTDALVAELRQARDGRRRMRLSTISTLILLTHIDRLERELANLPLVAP